MTSGHATLQTGNWTHGEVQSLALYGALTASRDRPIVFAQIGQSLDGRIATETGDAQDVSGPDGLAHLHRLRAIADAVVIGVKTALHDDPRLTVRLADGDSPARVVIDPDGRLPNDARLLRDTSVRRIIIQAVNKERPEGVETITLDRADWICPKSIIAALTERGFKRILIEGGGITIAQFLEADLLDRLHIAVAPLLIGSGPQSLTTSPIGTLAAARRPQMQAYNLGSDIVFDCALRPAAQAQEVSNLTAIGA
ncbi:MAG: RibD family protein [Pseudomonadota bacterium]